MHHFKYYGLQLFDGEGGDGTASASATAGQQTGETQAVDAEQRLRELGVPEDKLRRRANRNKAGATEPQQVAAPPKTEQAAAADPAKQAENATGKEETPKKASWEELMADPDYNKAMQETVKQRIKKEKEFQSKLAPALEILGRQYNIDTSNTDNLDIDGLVKAISDDDRFYEDKALELGVDVNEAKRLDAMERENARLKAEQEKTIQEQMIENHIRGLMTQAEQLKAVYPQFDIRNEMQNETFKRLTSPGVGLTVRDAYEVIHRDEIAQARQQATAQIMQQNVQAAQAAITNSIRTGQARPAENGTGQAAAVSSFDYSQMDKAQREAFKQRIRAAAARGEKIYPGQ